MGSIRLPHARDHVDDRFIADSAFIHRLTGEKRFPLQLSGEQGPFFRDGGHERYHLGSRRQAGEEGSYDTLQKNLVRDLGENVAIKWTAICHINVLSIIRILRLSASCVVFKLFHAIY